MSPPPASPPAPISLESHRRRVELERAIRAHRPMLDVIAVKLCRSQLDAGDLVQDVLERFVEHYDSIPAEVPARAWMLRVMHNRFIDLIRRLRPTTEVEPDEVAAPEAEPEPWWHQLSRDDVRARLDELPDELRDAFRLYTLDGLSYQEIAARLGVSRNTVGTRILRARRRLRASFAGGGHE